MNAACEFPLHHEIVVTLNATAEAAFAYLDDLRNLSSHMEKPSAAMLGWRMTITTDALGGRAVGSKVRMDGRMLGIVVSLEEVVIERQPPFDRVWQTVDAKLLVIERYRLAFTLASSGHGSLLRVFIDYDLPSQGPAHWLSTS